MSAFYSTAGIFLSLLYILISWLLPSFIHLDLVFGGILLVFMGIPHGAVDHLVAKRLKESRNEPFQLMNFLGKYLGVMLLYGIVWQYLPNLSFILFLGISVFHFGDLEHTSELKHKPTVSIYAWQIGRSVILGTGILGYILTSHGTEVNEILGKLPIDSTLRLGTLSSTYFLGMIVLGFQKEHTYYFVNTLLTLLLGSYIPLIPAFMCYFGACHAAYSLRVLSTSLHMPFAHLYAKLLPLTVVAIIMGVCYISWVSSEKWLAHAFIFLSILTLPHFFLMHQIAHKTHD